MSGRINPTRNFISNGVNPKIWLVMSVFIVALVNTSFAERIIYVDADSNGLNNGSSWTNAYKYLQDGLADAKSSPKPVEIRVAQGIYKPDQGAGITPGVRTATFQLVNGVTLNGAYAGFGEPDPNARDFDLYETILSGDLDGNDVDVSEPCDLLSESTRSENSYHVVTGSNTDVNTKFDGFIIKAGNANSHGGGMYIYEGSPLVTNCVFRENTSSNLSGCGGGMLIWFGSPILRSCIFEKNSSGYVGAGLGVLESGAVSIENCIFILNCGEGVYFQDALVTVSDSNFTNNTGRGAVIRRGDFNFTNCQFIQNEGGGLITDSVGIVENCIFTENTGGGIFIEGGGDVKVINSFFNSNESLGGGGLTNAYIATLIDCTFSDNRAESGGGIENGGNATITRCKFIGNSAYRFGGGGIACVSSAPLKVTDSIFVGNSAAEDGGGFYNWNSSPEITNCTFNRNSARYGGGFYSNFLGHPILTDCIFWEDSALIAGNELALLYPGYGDPSEMTVNFCNVQGGEAGVFRSVVNTILNWGPGNIDTDPCFVNPGYWDSNGTPGDTTDDFWVDGDYHLLPDSPCINAGDPNYISEPNETDIDGEQRVMFGRIDMGADEFNPIRLGIVKKTRTGRTQFVYDCNATFTNLWQFAVKNVQLQMMQVPENMTIIEPNVTFGDIVFETRQSITSIDTCTFQVDRSKAIEPDKIVWKVKCQRADTGMPLELTINGVSSGWLESISSNLTADEKFSIDDLARLIEQWLWIGAAGDIPEDITGDGIVNLRDFAVLAEQRLEGKP